MRCKLIYISYFVAFSFPVDSFIWRGKKYIYNTLLPQIKALCNCMSAYSKERALSLITQPNLLKA